MSDAMDRLQDLLNTVAFPESPEERDAAEDAIKAILEQSSGQGDGTNVFIQYKGTDLCADLYCDCGTHLHVDDYFAYAVKCWHCGAVWELPQKVAMVKVESSRWTPLETERDKVLDG